MFWYIVMPFFGQTHILQKNPHGTSACLPIHNASSRQDRVAASIFLRQRCEEANTWRAQDWTNGFGGFGSLLKIRISFYLWSKHVPNCPWLLNFKSWNSFEYGNQAWPLTVHVPCRTRASCPVFSISTSGTQLSATYRLCRQQVSIEQTLNKFGSRQPSTWISLQTRT